MSQYLVTGGAGFIGSHIVERLVNDGEDVRVLDDLSTGKRENLEDVIDKIVFIEGDIRDPSTVLGASDGVDYVLHLAAQGSVPRSIEVPARAMDVNTTGTLNVLLAARDKGVRRVVFSSSSSVYGKIDVERQVETLPTKPASPYALSKLASEHLCRLFSELYGLETVSLRYFNVFGPRQDPDSQYSAVIPLFVRQLMSGEVVEIHGEGTQSRDFTYVENVVEANLAALKQTSGSGGLYNIACGDTTSINQLFEMLQTFLGTDAKPDYVPRRAGDIDRSCADISEAMEQVQWTPSVRIQDGLARTVEWYKAQAKVEKKERAAA